jgi:hypothetical protein
MSKGPERHVKKAMAAMVILSVFILIPRSFAEELLAPIVGIVQGSTDAPSGAPVPTSESSIAPSGASSPSPSDSTAPVPVPTDQPAPTPSAIAESATPSGSPSPSASPSPTPKAESNQRMSVIVPPDVSVDPRAHSVFLPMLSAGGMRTLLVCGYSSGPAMIFGAPDNGALQGGSGSSTFRITGDPGTVMASLNGPMGLRLFSPQTGVAGSQITLRFISLTMPSIKPELCVAGNPSNTRTVFVRALGMDLNIIKDGVTLK